MTNNHSNIAVLIPHYNNPIDLEKTILSIVESIPIDVFIVDDGSTQKPNQTKLKEIFTLGKIQFIELQQNQGIEKALNVGLKEIEKRDYKYIGRLDCGDFCKPNRFLKQTEYLNINKDVFLLGTWVNVLDEKGNLLYVLEHPISYNELKKKMYLNSMFVHPSVVFRANIIDAVGYYPTNFKAAEDYAYFFNIIKKFKSENLPEILLDYIVDENSISSTKRKLQVKSRIRVIVKHFYLGFYPIIGLIRSVLLYFVSRDLSNKIKKLFNK